MREGKSSTAEPKKPSGGSKPAHEDRAAENPRWDTLALYVQPKLAVGTVDDPLEREADKLAGRVTGSGNPPASSNDEIPAGRFDAGRQPESAIPQGESGRPIEEPYRGFFQSRFHHDLSAVRLFTGTRADDAARSIDALAYTAGSNIVFSRDAYSPSTPGGARLLAHELSHVIQQGQAPPLEDAWPIASARGPIIQRQPAPAGSPHPGTVLEGKQGDVVYHVWPGEGLMSLGLGAEPWVTVRWTPQGGVSPNFTIAVSDLPRNYGIRVQADFDLRVTVDRATEEGFAQRMLGSTGFTHLYRSRGRRISVNQHLPSGETVQGEGDFADYKEYQGHDFYYDPELRPERPAPPPKLPPPFWWEFDNVRQLDVFAAVHPSYYWVAYQPADGGRLRALNLTEKNLQKVATDFREDPKVAASIFRLYEDGKPWPSLDPLYELFFDNEYLAALGAPGDAPECYVFTHGASSYGRKALTHTEAINEWRILEMIDSSAGSGAVATRAIGRGVFYKLIAIGRSGAKWEIDREYFELRDAFFANVRSQAAGTGQSWEDIFRTNLPVYEHYLRRALDRDEMAIDYDLEKVIDADSGLVAEVGARIYDDVQQFAWRTTLNLLETAQEGIGTYLDTEKLQGLVLQFPFMSVKERNDALTFLGVGPMFQPMYAVVLSKPEMAQLVAMGEAVAGVSLQLLQGWVAAQYNELEKVVHAIKAGDVEPLSMEGEFGDQIRRMTYENFGFNLMPGRFPHEDEAGMRAAAGGGRFSPAFSPYGSEAGFMFAQESARRARAARLKRYLLIAAAVVASVVLLIFAAEVAAVVAGLLFSTATTAGAIGFFVTEVVVSAAIITAVSPALNTFIMSGGTAGAAAYKKAYEGIGWQFLINLGAFGFFKALGYGVRAIAVLGAGGEEAFAVSRGWQAANVAMRITSSGFAMFGISLVSYYAQHGKLPEGESLNEIIFETGLSIVLLEIGSFLARPMTERLADWAEAKRLGDFKPRMDALRIEVRKLNMDTAAFGANPVGGQRTAIDLLARQDAALTEQRKLLDEMKQSYRTGPDAELLQKILAGELAAIDARLAAIRGVEAFAKAEVRPLGSTTEDVAEFSYRRGHEKDLEDYYGKDKVKVVGDHLEVSFEGKRLIFRPATDVEAGILPGGTRNPDALKAWRSTAISRMRSVIERAAKLNADDAALRDVAKADPNSMDRESMRKFERQLDKAEKLLDNLEKAAGPTGAVSINRDGAATEEWRQRLVSERERLARRAKLLGMEDNPVVKEMNRLPMNRSGLKENTLDNHRSAIEEARKVLDKAQADRMQALQLAGGGPPPELDAIRTKLIARRSDILNRARIYGASDREYIKAVDRLRNIGATKDLGKLNDAEAVLERAEARLDELAKKALEKAVQARGADAIAGIRAMPGLEKLSDAQVGDVLRALGEAGHTLRENALRGALLASVAPKGARSAIPIERVARLARSPAELEFVLDTFARLTDAQVAGSFDLLRDASSSADFWKGSVWQMEVARYVIGIEKIAAFEKSVSTASGGRDIDIVLRDGRVIETKDWDIWRPEKLDDQFFKDLEYNTNDGAQPDGLKKIQWLFRSPPPASLAKIRSTMRATLERFITEKNLGKNEADALRRAFDEHLQIVDSPRIDRTQVVPVRPLFIPPPPPPHRDDQP